MHAMVGDGRLLSVAGRRALESAVRSAVGSVGFACDGE